MKIVDAKAIMMFIFKRLINLESVAILIFGTIVSSKNDGLIASGYLRKSGFTSSPYNQGKAI
jgi:hypothetical protein